MKSWVFTFAACLLITSGVLYSLYKLDFDIVSASGYVLINLPSRQKTYAYKAAKCPLSAATNNFTKRLDEINVTMIKQQLEKKPRTQWFYSDVYHYFLQNRSVSASCSYPRCYVPYSDGARLSTHLRDRNVHRILMAGDSHGFRHFEALRNILESSGYVCATQLQEGGKNQAQSIKDYITKRSGIDPRVVQVGYRGCFSCRYTLLFCASDTHHIQLEFLGTVYFLNTVMPNRNMCEKIQHLNAVSKLFCSAKSQLEFLFRYYLQLVSSPDVVIVPITLNHDLDKTKDIATASRPYIEVLRGFLEECRLNSVLWLSSPCEREHYKRRRNELLVKTSHNILSSLHHNVSQVQMLTYDLSNKTCDRAVMDMKWGSDGIHYPPPLYQQIIKEVLEQWMNTPSN